MDWNGRQKFTAKEKKKIAYETTSNIWATHTLCGGYLTSAMALLQSCPTASHFRRGLLLQEENYSKWMSPQILARTQVKMELTNDLCIEMSAALLTNSSKMYGTLKIWLNVDVREAQLVRKQERWEQLRWPSLMRSPKWTDRRSHHVQKWLEWPASALRLIDYCVVSLMAKIRS